MENNIPTSAIEDKVKEVAESREAGHHRLNRAVLLIIAIILIFAFYVQMEIVRTYLTNSSKQSDKYSSKIGFLEGMNKYFYEHLLGQNTSNKTKITGSDETLTQEQLTLQNKLIDKRISQLLQTGLSTSNTGITYTYNSTNNTITSNVTLDGVTTTNLREGDNLYFTDQRVYSALHPQAPLFISQSGGLGMRRSTTSTDGYLSSEDFTTFNNKEDGLSFSTGLSRTDDTVTNTLAVGKSGGQSIFGGTEARDTLTLNSTTNDARGGIFLNPNGGNVGIGTTNPQNTLSVNGTINASSSISSPVFRPSTSIIFPDGTTQTTAAAGGGGVSAGTGGYFAYYPSDGSQVDDQSLMYTNGTNIGVGTSSPTAKFDIVGGLKTVTTNSVSLTAQSTSSIGVDSISTSSIAVLGTSGSGEGIYGLSTTGYGVRGASGSGIGGFFNSTSGYALVTGAGNVGIGTATPANPLYVQSNVSGSTATVLVNNSSGASNAITATEYRAGGSGSYAAVGFVGGSSSAGFGAQSEAFVITEGEGLNLISAAGGAQNGIKFHVGTFPVLSNPQMVLDGNSRLGIGSVTPEFRLDVNEGVIARGTNGSGTILSTSGPGTRMLWYPRKSAFRVGHIDAISSNGYSGDEWDNANIAQYSVAMGYNTVANGLYSFSMGHDTLASNGGSIAMGVQVTATGGSTVSLGSDITNSGQYGVALGSLLTVSATQGVAIGNNLKATALNSVVIGRGASPGLELVNNVPNSLMVGFASNEPTFTVSNPLVSSAGRVGINTSSPGETFHVAAGNGSESGFFRLDNLAPAAATQVCYDGSNRFSSCSSSQQFKENIKYLTNSDYNKFLNDIVNTEVATFDYKTDHPGQQRLGIIAEQAPNFLQYQDQHGNTNIDFYSYQGGYAWAGIKALAMNMQNIKVNIDPMATDISSLKDKVSTLSSKLEEIPKDSDVTEVASFSATLAAMSDRMDTLTDELDTLKGQVLGASVADTLDQAESILAEESTATLAALTVSGKTTVNDLGVTGMFTDGLFTFDGINGTVDTLSGPLKIQSLALGNVDLQGGKIEMDTKGNITLKEGSLFIKQGIISGNDTFVGNLTVPKGQTSVTITKTWNKKPGSIILTPSFEAKVWVTDISATGFVVHVDQPAETDRTVNWIAFWGD